MNANSSADNDQVFEPLREATRIASEKKLHAAQKYQR
jgi:hypothetical protein